MASHPHHRVCIDGSRPVLGRKKPKMNTNGTNQAALFFNERQLETSSYHQKYSAHKKVYIKKEFHQPMYSLWVTP